MGMIATVTQQLPVWGLVAVWAYIAYIFLSGARAEERRRRDEGQPHTKKDTALLLLTALSVVGIVLCAVFLKVPLVNSRAGIAVIILVVGGGLTYVFNRRRAPHR
jgi:heme A synthase